LRFSGEKRDVRKSSEEMPCENSEIFYFVEEKYLSLTKFLGLTRELFWQLKITSGRKRLMKLFREKNKTLKVKCAAAAAAFRLSYRGPNTLRRKILSRFYGN
jgi:hypothetical protein